MNPRVINVKAERDFVLRIWFEDGKVKLFDLKPLLGKGVFSELSDTRIFSSVKPFMGSIQWCNGLDLCPDTLYEEGETT